MGVQLVDAALRDRSSDEVANLIRKFTHSVPGIVKLNIRTGSSVGAIIGMGVAPIQIDIKGDDLDELEAVGLAIRDAVREVQGPEFHIIVDRERAASLGLNTYVIASAVRTHVYGVEATKLREGGDQWEVIVRAPAHERDSIDDILALPIPSATGQMVRLSSVASVEMGVGPTEIRRRDQERIVKVQGRLLDRALGEVSADIAREIGKLTVPPSVTVEMGGDIEQQQETFGDLGLLLLLSIALVYMVMASQFESLLDPFIVMFSIPFAFVGVVWAFVISNTTLSMTSFLGVIMLMGIVVNNAIVLIDYTNILRKRGLTVKEAVTTSGKRRLRPVLMTAFTTIFGMLPLAVMQYTGSEVWRPLGVAMIGGLLVSTMVTLVLVPTLYTIFEGRLRKNARWSR